MNSSLNRTIEDVDEEAEDREFILQITLISVSAIICISAVVIYCVVKKRHEQGKCVSCTCFMCRRERGEGVKKAGGARVVQVLPKSASGTMKKTCRDRLRTTTAIDGLRRIRKNNIL